MKHLSSLVIYPYLSILIGALLGAALGYFGQCSSGTCPLTSTWWRGALYGGTMGLLFAFSAPSKRAGDSRSETPTDSSQSEEASDAGHFESRS